MNHTVESLGDALIRHDSCHERIFLTRLDPENVRSTVQRLEWLAHSCGYTKICAKIPTREAEYFVAAGYRMEAAIPYFYPDGSALCFMAKYYCEERRTEHLPLMLGEVLEAIQRQPQAAPPPLPSGFVVKVARTKDLPELAALYREFPASRPFTAGKSADLAGALKQGNMFFGVWRGDLLVATACAALDEESESAQLSGFARFPEYRGNGFLLHLVRQAETSLNARGIRSLCTIVNAYSPGPNLAFARSGYSFCGTLTNNEIHFERTESANVWYKSLAGGYHNFSYAMSG